MARQAARMAAPTPTDDAAPQTEAPADRSGRTPDGKFARGNRGGPGNPFARRVAELRCAFVGAVLPEDLQQIARRLITMAAMGDLAAAKLVMGYLLGKVPGPVDPDTLDQQECRMYQQNMTCTEIGQIVQHQPPSDMAAGILRCSEIANAERAHQLAQQIREEDAQRESLEKASPASMASTEDVVVDQELTAFEPARSNEVPADCKRVKPSPSRRGHRQPTAANGGVHIHPAGMPRLPIGDNGGSSSKEAIAQPRVDASVGREPVGADEAGPLSNGSIGIDGGQATAAAPLTIGSNRVDGSTA